jgi:hypothetical protein
VGDDVWWRVQSKFGYPSAPTGPFGSDLAGICGLTLSKFEAPLLQVSGMGLIFCRPKTNHLQTLLVSTSVGLSVSKNIKTKEVHQGIKLGQQGVLGVQNSEVFSMIERSKLDHQF